MKGFLAQKALHWPFSPKAVYSPGRPEPEACLWPRPAPVFKGHVWVGPAPGAGRLAECGPHLPWELSCMPDFMFPVLAQERPGPWPWGTVASVTGSSPPGVSAASLAGRLGRAQKDRPLGTVFLSGTSSASWGWPSSRTRLCPSLSARTATPSSTSATASSRLSCRESTSPPRAAGSLVQSRRPPSFAGGVQETPQAGRMGTGRPGWEPPQGEPIMAGEADAREHQCDGCVGGGPGGRPRRRGLRLHAERPGPLLLSVGGAAPLQGRCAASDGGGGGSVCG